MSGSLDVSGSVTAQGFTGSLFGTSSWALNAITSSYSLTATSASYALTASYALNVPVTSSYAISASYALSSSFASSGNGTFSGSFSGSFQGNGSGLTNIPASGIVGLNLSQIASGSATASISPTTGFTVNTNTTITGSTIISGSLTVTGSTNLVGGTGNVFSANIDTMVFTGSLYQSGSIVVNGSVNATNFTGSLLGTASYATQALTASYSNNSTSASYALNATSASYAFNATSASYAFNATTSSYSLTATSASYAVTASSADDFIVRGTLIAQTIVAQYITSSTQYITGSTKFGSDITNTHQFTGSVSISGSLTVTDGVVNNLTASNAVTASYANTATSASYAITSSYSNNSTSASYAFAATSASYALTASYAENITVSGSITNVDYIDFDTTASFAAAIGRLGYDSGEGTLTLGLAGGNVTLKVGTDLYQYVYNDTTASMTLGQVVYISGSQGNRIAVKLASATAEQGSANTLGFVAETIPAGSEGWVMTEGTLRKLNTLGLVGGQLIYLSTTPGAYTQTPPVAPNHGVRLGYAERISATVGSIYVKIDNGYELGELHDVIDSTTSGSYGDLLVKSGSVWINSKQLTGSYTLTGSLSTTGSNTFIGTQTVTGSLFTSGSNTLIGSTTLTGSLNITGSTTQVGNNNLFGNTTLSGSIIISGSTGTNNPTVKIYGDTTHNGYIRFDPVTTNIDTSISASYIYVSGSTNDLYFSQNGSGYNNVTRLRWLEGNLYTGLLSGGVLTSTIGSTTFNLSSGSAIVVNLNASTGSADPYPTIQYVKWNNYTNIPITYSGSANITYVGLDNTGTIIQQTVPWGSTDVTQWDTQVELGVVLHLSGSVSTGVYNSPQLGYGYAQRTDDFVRAFGPLKITGHTLQPSGSTLGLVKTGGTSFNNGSNYIINANHPSTVTEGAVTTSKIYRYYVSGSTPIIDVGITGSGYTSIDPTKYNNNGTLSNVPGGSYTIQRVFWIPNSPTNAFLVYYGNATYSSAANAQAGIDTEPFTEAPNTAQNAILVAYVIVAGGESNLQNASFIQGGLFRSIAGIGNSNTAPVSNTLAGLSDVSVGSRLAGDLLYYNGSQWVNSKTLVGNYVISGSFTTNDGITAVNINATSFTGSLLGTASYATQALTASYSLNATSASYAFNSTTASYALNATSASYALNATSASYATNTDNAQTASYVLQAVSASFATLAQTANTASYVLNAVSASYALNATTASYSLVATSASYAFNSTTASYVLNAVSASYALTASFVANAQTASYVLNAISASYALTASYSNNSTSASYALDATSASYAFNATSASYSLSSSYALTSTSASYALVATSASYAFDATTASYALNSTSASYAVNATSASYSLNTTSASYALTASNVQGGSQYYAAIWKDATSLTTGSIFNSGSFVGINKTNPSYSIDSSGVISSDGFLPYLGFSTPVGRTFNYVTSFGSGNTINYPGTGTAGFQYNYFANNELYTTAGGTSNLLMVGFRNQNYVRSAVSTVPFQMVALNNLLIANDANDLGTLGQLYTVFTSFNREATASPLGGNPIAYHFNTQTRLRSGFYTTTRWGNENLQVADTAGSQASTITDYDFLLNTTNVGSTSGGPGTITNFYLLRHVTNIGATGTITNRWGLYLTDSSFKSYHAGNFLLGTTDNPGYKLNVSGSGNFTDGLTVTGSIVATQNITASNALITGTLTAQTIVVQTITSSTDFVTGSTRFGTLLSNTHQFTGSVSVTGSLAASLTNINQNNVVGYDTTTGQLYYQSTSSLSVTTASYALTATSASFASTASHANSGFTIGISQIKTATVASSIAGANNLFTDATGSFSGAKYLYTVTNGTNARTGEVLAIWAGGSVQYTDNSTLDLGSTTAVTASVSIVTAQAQFNVQTNTSGWTIKSQVTYL